MFSQEQPISQDDQPSRQQAPTDMRMLTIEELCEVVGGPIIDNGMGIAAAATVSGSGQ
jgi:hypothetical protein